MMGGDKRTRYGVEHERRHRKRGHDDCFRVRANIGALDQVDKAPIELIDSQRFDPGGLDPGGFDEDTRIAHGIKRRDGRADKGRLFYITAGGEAVAYIAFHVPPGDGPLIVENLVFHTKFAGSKTAVARIRRVLLHAALEASESAGRTTKRLAWATDSQAKAERITAEFGFAVTSRPRKSDCTLAYYLERSFPPPDRTRAQA